MVQIERGQIHGTHVDYIIWRVEDVIAGLAKVPKSLDGRRCGYFSIRRRDDGRLLLLAQVGECPREKAGKYQRLCLEKGQRLFVNKDHASSWQSRNEKAGQWGGAIVAGDLILSFSGLPELTDEAVVLLVNIYCAFTGPLDAELELEKRRAFAMREAKRIARVSSNWVFQKALRAKVLVC